MYSLSSSSVYRSTKLPVFVDVSSCYRVKEPCYRVTINEQVTSCGLDETDVPKMFETAEVYDLFKELSMFLSLQHATHHIAIRSCQESMSFEKGLEGNVLTCGHRGVELQQHHCISFKSWRKRTSLVFFKRLYKQPAQSNIK